MVSGLQSLNYDMALYELTPYGVRNTISLQDVPDDRHNRDWKMYQDWLDLGNLPDPHPILPTIDQEWDSQNEWLKALAQELGVSHEALKARVIANKSKQWRKQ